MLSFYYPTRRIVGANVDQDEKMRILAPYRECLMKSYHDTRREAFRFKQEIKDNLLKGLIFEETNGAGEYPATGTINDNVVYYICGYLIHKYRKYSCKHCLSTINLDLDLLPETLTFERLTLIRSRGWLKLASTDFFRLISHVESKLQEHSLLDDIYVNGAFETILNTVNESALPKVGCEEHSKQFVVNCIYDYLLLRFKAIARRKKQQMVDKLAAQRHANRKKSKV